MWTGVKFEPNSKQSMQLLWARVLYWLQTDCKDAKSAHKPDKIKGGARVYFQKNEHFWLRGQVCAQAPKSTFRREREVEEREYGTHLNTEQKIPAIALLICIK